MFALLTLPRGRVSPRRAAAFDSQREDAYGIVIRPARRDPSVPAPAPLMTADMSAD